MIRILVWVVFVAVVAILYGREWLHFHDLKGTGEASENDRARYRRRSLGLGVLVLLAGMADAGTYFDRFLDAPLMLSYYGVCFIVLIWLLIIATRDFRAVGESWVHQRERMAIEALRELEQELRENNDPEDRAIPPLDFDQTRD